MWRHKHKHTNKMHTQAQLKLLTFSTILGRGGRDLWTGSFYWRRECWAGLGRAKVGGEQALLLSHRDICGSFESSVSVLPFFVSFPWEKAFIWL